VRIKKTENDRGIIISTTAQGTVRAMPQLRIFIVCGSRSVRAGHAGLSVTGFAEFLQVS
jgi:hypothetical protein